MPRRRPVKRGCRKRALADCSSRHFNHYDRGGAWHGARINNPVGRVWPRRGRSKMFLSHRAWRHAYATAYWQQACLQRRSSEAQNDKLRHGMFSWSSGPMFGVRRPLRHLAWKLNLDEDQVRKLVDILDKLKTGYAQARLDRDRSTSDHAAA